MLQTKEFSFMVLLIVLMTILFVSCRAENANIDGSYEPTSTFFSNTASTSTEILKNSITTHPNHTSTPLITSMTLEATKVITSTPANTFEPKQVEQILRDLLNNPEKCLSPCFLGIIPKKTTFDEAINTFIRLGIPLHLTLINDGKEFYANRYEFRSGLTVALTLTIRDEMVANSRMYITPEIAQPGVAREWLAYSPETLISQYGSPSKIDFWVDRGAPNISYEMVMYFENKNFIALYNSYDIYVNENSFMICPSTDQIETVRLWLGEDPEHPPGNAVLLEEATDISIKDFSTLLTGDAENACLELKAGLFP